MFTIGLDVHSRRSEICVLDEHGKPVRHRTVKGSPRELVKELREFKEPFRVCYEASCGAGWLYDQLRPLAHSVTVAHPAHLQLIFRSKKKNDRADAAKLAMLLLMDQVPAVHVPSIDVRAWRKLIEHRRRLVDKRTRAKNGVRALLRGNVVQMPARLGLWSAKGIAWLKTLDLPTPSDALQRDLFVEEIEHFDKQIARVTDELDTRAKAHPGVTLLRTIPGVGNRTAEALAAYIDDPKRFRTIHTIGSYFGLVPTQDQSGSTNRLGHITRQGPGTVRLLLVQAAWRGTRSSPSLKKFFDRIVNNDPDRRKIALVALAHHLARTALSMLRSGAVWEERLVSDEELSEWETRKTRGREKREAEGDRVDGRGDEAPLPSQSLPSTPPRRSPRPARSAAVLQTPRPHTIEPA